MTTCQSHTKSRTPARVMTAAAAAAALLTLAQPAHAASADAPLRTWATNGRVSAIMPVGDRIYVGGTFSAVTDVQGNSYPASNLAVFVASTGAFDRTWRGSTNGAVWALAASGSTLYVGGDFSAVDGTARSRLAAVDTSTGALSSGWVPRADRRVEALAASGGHVYVGGNFTKVHDRGGWHARPYAARLDPSTGAVDAAWVPTPSARVRALLASADGSHVYLGGDFTTVSGSRSANKVASIRTTDGSVDAGFRVNANNAGTLGPVYDLATDGSVLTMAVGGQGGACTAVAAGTGAAMWSKHANGNVQTTAIHNGTVYCGGHFGGAASFDGLTRYKLAAVGLSSGVTTSFAPRVNSALGVWAVRATASQLFVGGDFTKVAGVSQAHFAVFQR